MIARLISGALLLGILAGIALLLLAGADQAAPNATRQVIGARQGWCAVDGRWVRQVHTGWLPTVQCSYPPRPVELPDG